MILNYRRWNRERKKDSDNVKRLSTMTAFLVQFSGSLKYLVAAQFLLSINSTCGIKNFILDQTDSPCII